MEWFRVLAQRLGTCSSEEGALNYLVRALKTIFHRDRSGLVILRGRKGILEAYRRKDPVDDGSEERCLSRFGEYLCALAIEKRDLVIRESAVKDESFSDSSGTVDWAVVAVPIFVGRDVFGALAVERVKEQGGFSDRELWFLRAAGVVGAAAMQRTRVQMETEKRLGKLQMVGEINSLLVSGRSPQALLDDLVIYTAKTFSAGQAILYIANPAGGNFRIGASFGSEPVDPSPLTVGCDSLDWVARQEHALMTSHPLDLTVVVPPQEADGTGPRYAMLAPLRSEGRVLGVLTVAEPLERGEYTQADLETLSFLAQQASVTVENVRLRWRLEQMAITDELTGLANRRAFRSTLLREFERARRYGRPLSLLMMDLDHFKQVNDTFGHPTGDIVLANVGKLLTVILRRVDLPARFGGEEFAVIMPDTDKESALLVAERLRRCIREADLFSGKQSRTITLSAGIACYPEDAQAPDELIRAADDALYAAKRTGRDRACTA